MKTRLKARVSELEDELKKMKADLEKAKQQGSATGEDEVCTAALRASMLKMAHLFWVFYTFTSVLPKAALLLECCLLHFPWKEVVLDHSDKLDLIRMY